MLLTLMTIKQYLVKQKQASLSQLTTHFQTDKQTIEPMLKHWIRNNLLIKENLSCLGCSTNNCNDKTVIYKWQ